VAAVILTCDANRLLRWDYRTVAARVAECGTALQRWHLSFRPDVGPGTEAWLLLQGSNDAGSGLIGHGFVASEPCQPVPGGDPDALGWFVTVAFDALLPLGEQIRPGILGDALPGDPWAQVAGPTLVTLPPSYAPGLRRLWRDWGPTTTGPAEVVGGTLPPGAVSAVQVDRYERDPDARRACLAFHGTSCAACGFSFESSYGEAAAAALAVHHVVPPAVLDGGYQPDPLADLVPLCHNCHAVAHMVNPPRTVSELRTIIAEAGHLRGAVVTDLALQAQEDARRIVEGGQA